MSLFSGKWAADQTRTFFEDAEFEREWRLIAGEGVQRVNVNVEEDWMKSWLVRMSVGALRKQWPKEEWGRYFFVRRGFTSDLREGLGIANGKVGFVYFVDEECKIRWAACGNAADGEAHGLVRGVRKLVEDRKKEREYVDEGRNGVGKSFDSGVRSGVAIGAVT